MTDIIVLPTPQESCSLQFAVVKAALQADTPDIGCVVNFVARDHSQGRPYRYYSAWRIKGDSWFIEGHGMLNYVTTSMTYTTQELMDLLDDPRTGLYAIFMPQWIR